MTAKLLCRIGRHSWHIVAYNGPSITPACVEECRRCGIKIRITKDFKLEYFR